MKKLYKGLMATVMVLGLAACGAPDVNTLDDTVRADGNVGGYAMVGPNTWQVGDTHIANWGEFDGTGVGKLTAVSYRTVGKKNYELGKYLQDKKVPVVYMVEDARAVTEYATGSKVTWGPDKKEVDSGFTIKFAAYDHDEDNNKDAISQWLPDPHKAQAHSMTPDTLWITDNYAEEKDEYGYDWTTNPTIISGAGKYTLVLAKYAEPLESGAQWGMGAILEEKMEEAGPKALDHWKLTGSMNGWKPEEDTEGMAFSKEGTLTYDFKVDDLFKITKYFTTKEGSWDGAINGENIVSEDGGFENDGTNDKNIKCKKAGKYTVTINEDGTKATFVLAA